MALFNFDFEPDEIFMTDEAGSKYKVIVKTKPNIQIKSNINFNIYF